MISGSGNTIVEADKRLSKERTDLTNKLSKENVSMDLNVDRSHYQGIYDLKGDCTSDACETHFTLESDKGWEAIQKKAKTHTGHNTHYETKFSVEQYIKLTLKQQEALDPPKPTAGRDTTGYNPLEKLRL